MNKDTVVNPLRHQEVFNPDLWGERRVDVVGLGSRGSRAALELAKMGISNLHLWDPATIDDEDVGDDLYGPCSLGKNKASCLAEFIRREAGTKPVVHECLPKKGEMLGESVFLFCDEPDRRAVFQDCVRYKIKTKVMIDAHDQDGEAHIYLLNPMAPAEVREYESDTAAPLVHPLIEGHSEAAGEVIAELAVYQLIRWFAVQNGKNGEDEVEHELIVKPSLFHNVRLDGPELGQRIDVIGAGATGSRITLGLAKAGFTNIHAWDFDNVESHNIANQAFALSDIERPKVDALRDLVKMETGVEITAHNQRVTGDEELGDIVFVLVDSMSMRKAIYDKIKGKVTLMVETRMGTDQGRVYCIEPAKHGPAYEKTLYADAQAEVSSCGTPITVGPTAGFIAGVAVSQLIRWLSCQKDDLLCQPAQEVLFALRPWLVWANHYGA